jgi:hypothetical protein
MRVLLRTITACMPSMARASSSPFRPGRSMSSKRVVLAQRRQAVGRDRVGDQYPELHVIPLGAPIRDARSRTV